jgi:hypothetical protein
VSPKGITLVTSGMLKRITEKDTTVLLEKAAEQTAELV